MSTIVTITPVVSCAPGSISGSAVITAQNSSPSLWRNPRVIGGCGVKVRRQRVIGNASGGQRWPSSCTAASSRSLTVSFENSSAVSPNIRCAGALVITTAPSIDSCKMPVGTASMIWLSASDEVVCRRLTAISVSVSAGLRWAASCGSSSSSRARDSASGDSVRSASSGNAAHHCQRVRA